MRETTAMRTKKAARAVALCAVVLVAALLPAADAIAAPTIQLLNPSDYSPTLRISTKSDANGDTQYHLVAWAGDVPSNPFVEFEIAPTPSIPGGPDPAPIATVDGTLV